MFASVLPSCINMGSQVQFSVFTHIALLCESFGAVRAGVGFHSFMHSGVVEHIPSGLHLFQAIFVLAPKYCIGVPGNGIFLFDSFVLVVLQNQEVDFRLRQLLGLAKLLVVMREN